MKRRKPRKRGGPKPGEGIETLSQWRATEEGSLRSCAFDYLKHLETTHMSLNTVDTRRGNLSLFFRWCDERSMLTPAEVDRSAVEAYQRFVFRYKKANGKPLAISTQWSRLYVIKDYFRYLARRYVILYNPAGELDMPRNSVRLPRSVFTSEEVETIMDQPDTATPEGLRDRAILEVFYSTGIRRMELAGLSLYDIDQERGVLMIREGKGRKDRVVPIADRALRWLQLYIDQARPLMELPCSESALFLSFSGERLALSSLSNSVRDHVTGSGIEKKGSCHLFRHTVATLMLENGADVRYIQQMLGHADLKTTQVYTHVSIKQLKTVHNLTHPTNTNGKASTQKPPPEQPPPV